MSGIINKVKDKVADLTHNSNSGSTNAGPHSSNAANAADPRVDSDRDGRGGLGHNTTTGTGIGGAHHTTGTHGSHGVTGTSGHGSSGANTTAGPHNSDMMNKIDPRVDSDLSGGHPGSNAAYTSTGTTGTTGTYGSSGLTGGSTNAGPHNSNMANKMDPRVDSDLDGGRHAGMNQTTGTHGQTGGLTGSTGTYGSSGVTGGSTNAGPHNSNMANKLDPRVDSDLDGGRHAGMNQTTGGYGTTGTTGTSGFSHGSTNAGPHNSNMANKVDPRVDSDLDGGRHGGLNQTTGGTHSGTGLTGSHGTHGTHNTSGNTGPVHNSNLLNKLDPRVDSDADGSRNAGMTQSSTTHNTGSTRAEPLDASKHGPTAFKEVHGDPQIHHEFPGQATSGRHGSIGTSDQHYGSGAV